MTGQKQNESTAHMEKIRPEWHNVKPLHMELRVEFELRLDLQLSNTTWLLSAAFALFFCAATI